MDKSTNINDLPFKKQSGMPQMGPGGPQMSQPQRAGPPPPINTAPDSVQPSQRFAQQPQQMGPGPSIDRSQMGPGPQIGGPGQGFSSPEKPTSGNNREFFGLKETDYKSTVVVFALILIFSSSFFFETMKTYLPAVVHDGKTTLVGSLIAALLGAIIYIIIKCVANLS